MKTIILNIEDSIFDEILNSLKSYPKKKLRIIDDNPTQEELSGFSEDLRGTFMEIKQIKEGKRQARTWWDVKDINFSNELKPMPIFSCRETAM